MSGGAAPDLPEVRSAQGGHGAAPDLPEVRSAQGGHGAAPDLPEVRSEGGHGAVPVEGVPAGSPTPTTASRGDWPLWEVFVRARRGLSHTHVGSLHAPDAPMALRNARDLYTRRQEGVSLWVVPSATITASSPDEADPFFAPADKPYRHPTFYDVPQGVQHL